MQEPDAQQILSDYFQLEKNLIEGYGAFDVSLLSDFSLLFIDPFLLFNSENPDYKTLHKNIISCLLSSERQIGQQERTPGLRELSVSLPK